MLDTVVVQATCLAITCVYSCGDHCLSLKLVVLSFSDLCSASLVLPFEGPKRCFSTSHYILEGLNLIDFAHNFLRLMTNLEVFAFCTLM